MDSRNNPLSLNDCVKVVKGYNRGKKAMIKCLFKKYAFLYNKDFGMSYNIFVEHTNNLEIMGSELLDEDKMNQVKLNAFTLSDKVKKLLGKTVKIIRGTWKGLAGNLKSADQNKAKVELLSRNKTITVDVDDIMDFHNKELSNNDIMNTPREFGGNVNKTPGYYPQSPNLYGTSFASPKWNPTTPNHWSGQSPFHTTPSHNNWN